MTNKPESVLVIDDDDSVRRVLVAILQREGIPRVEQAANAEEVEGRLKTERYSIIVVDYHLGGASGVDMLERLRKNGDRTPVLLISGVPNFSGVVRTALHERVDFIGKPFKIDELVAAVERLMTP